MSRGEADLRLSKVNFSKALQQARVMTSSVLEFTLQWKDLEKNLDARLENVENKEKEIELRERSFEATQMIAEDLSMKIMEKEDTLFSTERRLKECDDEVRLGEEKLKNLQGLLTVTSQSVEAACQRLISAQNSLNDCNRKLDDKKVELKSVEDSLVERSRKLRSALEEKTRDYRVFEEKLKNCCTEIASKEKQHDELIRKIGECDESLERRKVELKSVEDSLIERSRKFRSAVEEKTREYKVLEEKLKNCCTEIASKEKQHDELISKIGECHETLERRKVELKSVEDSLIEHSRKIRSAVEEKTREYRVLEEKLKNCCTEIASKEKQHDELIRKIGDCDETLERRNEHVKQLETLILESNKQLAVEETKQNKFIDELELKKSQVEQQNKFIDDLQKEIKLKSKSAEEYVRKIKLKTEELDSVHREINEARGNLGLLTAKTVDLKSREEEVASVRASLEEGKQMLVLKEIEYEERLRKFHLKEADFASKETEAASLRSSLEQLSKTLAEKERQLQLQVKIEKDDYPSRKESPLSLDSLLKIRHSVISCDPHKLWSLVCAYLGFNDLVDKKVTKALQWAKDPAELVLQAIISSNTESRFSFDIIKRSSILLLSELSQVHSEIRFTPDLKKSALSVALQWKTKLNREKTIDVLAFLQFLAIYEVAHCGFDPDEIQGLLKLIPDDKQDALHEALSLSGHQQGSRSFGKCVVKIE